MAGKTVLITGCSANGIGHALALEFQKRGLTVFATARNLSKMSELSSLPNMHLLTLDVTSPTEIALAVQAVEEKAGRLDYLVNNSGQQSIVPALDADIETAKEIFEVNFWGVVRMTQAFAPLLIASKGTVVNIGSVVVPLCPVFSSTYNASKAAIHAFSNTLRLELQPLGVSTLTVTTGSIATSINTNHGAVTLPPNSHYQASVPCMNSVVDNSFLTKWTSPEDFARGLVRDILKGKTGMVYRGTNSLAARYLPGLLPRVVIDGILTNKTGLDKVGEEMKAKTRANDKSNGKQRRNDDGKVAVNSVVTS